LLEAEASFAADEAAAGAMADALTKAEEAVKIAVTHVADTAAEADQVVAGVKAAAKKAYAVLDKAMEDGATADQAVANANIAAEKILADQVVDAQAAIEEAAANEAVADQAVAGAKAALAQAAADQEEAAMQQVLESDLSISSSLIHAAEAEANKAAVGRARAALDEAMQGKAKADQSVADAKVAADKVTTDQIAHAQAATHTAAAAQAVTDRAVASAKTTLAQAAVAQEGAVVQAAADKATAEQGLADATTVLAQATADRDLAVKAAADADETRIKATNGKTEADEAANAVHNNTPTEQANADAVAAEAQAVVLKAEESFAADEAAAGVMKNALTKAKEAVKIAAKNVADAAARADQVVAGAKAVADEATAVLNKVMKDKATVDQAVVDAKAAADEARAVQVVANQAALDTKVAEAKAAADREAAHLMAATNKIHAAEDASRAVARSLDDLEAASEEVAMETEHIAAEETSGAAAKFLQDAMDASKAAELAKVVYATLDVKDEESELSDVEDASKAAAMKLKLAMAYSKAAAAQLTDMSAALEAADKLKDAKAASEAAAIQLRDAEADSEAAAKYLNDVAASKMIAAKDLEDAVYASEKADLVVRQALAEQKIAATDCRNCWKAQAQGTALRDAVEECKTCLKVQTALEVTEAASHDANINLRNAKEISQAAKKLFSDVQSTTCGTEENVSCTEEEEVALNKAATQLKDAEDTSEAATLKLRDSTAASNALALDTHRITVEDASGAAAESLEDAAAAVKKKKGAAAEAEVLLNYVLATTPNDPVAVKDAEDAFDAQARQLQLSEDCADLAGAYSDAVAMQLAAFQFADEAARKYALEIGGKDDFASVAKKMENADALAEATAEDLKHATDSSEIALKAAAATEAATKAGEYRITYFSPLAKRHSDAKGISDAAATELRDAGLASSAALMAMQLFNARVASEEAAKSLDDATAASDASAAELAVAEDASLAAQTYKKDVEDAENAAREHAKSGMSWSQQPGIGDLTSLSFVISHSTLAFQAGYGSGGTTVSLNTMGADGTYSVVKRKINPVGDRLTHYSWDVSGMDQEMAVIVLSKPYKEDQHVRMTNVRLFDQAPGCISECLMIQEDTEDADRLRFMNMLYSPVNPGTSFRGEASALYCAHDLTKLLSVGETIGPVFAGQFPDRMTDQNLQTPANLPSCIMVRKVDEKSFDVAVEQGAQRYLFSNDEKHTPDGITDSALHCVYPTSQPQCLDYHGILSGSRQADMFCSEVDPSTVCSVTVINKYCPLERDITCGDDKKLRDALSCCEKNNNRGGSCLSRRRLGASAKGIQIADNKVLDGDMVESCARACLSEADTCVAWRINDFDNSCKLATKCFQASANEVKALDISQLRWHLKSVKVNPYGKDATHLLRVAVV